MLSPRRPEVVSKLKITFNAERTVIKRLYLKIGVEIKESRIVRKKIGATVDALFSSFTLAV
jgi:hypothetical protein